LKLQEKSMQNVGVKDELDIRLMKEFTDVRKHTDIYHQNALLRKENCIGIKRGKLLRIWVS
jgi:hypothetical protein